MKQPEPNAATVQNVQSPAVAQRAATARVRRLQAATATAGQVVASNVAAPATAGQPTEANPDPFDRELKGFQYDVTRGDWPAVKVFLARLPAGRRQGRIRAIDPEPEQHAGHAGQHADANADAMQQMQMNMGMPFGMNTPNAPMPQQFMMERNVFTNQDIFALAQVRSPRPGRRAARRPGPDPPPVAGFGQRGRGLRRQAAGRVETSRPQEAPLTERQAAKVLFGGRLHGRGRRVPARRPRRPRPTTTARPSTCSPATTWPCTPATRRPCTSSRPGRSRRRPWPTGKVDRAQKDEAIRRAVELTPKIREALGRTWLEESFTQRPERGMEIIAAIGADIAAGLADPRLRRRLPAQVARAAKAGRRGPAQEGTRARQGLGRAAWPCWPRPGCTRPSSPTITTTRPASAPACSTTPTATSTTPTTIPSHPK